MTLLSTVDVRLSLPGLTKLISKLNKAGQWREGLTVFHVLPSLGLVPDATVANAALGACDRGGDGAAAWSIFEIMEVCALEADAITYKALVAALSKSGHWRRCVLVCAAVLSAVFTVCCRVMAAEEGVLACLSCRVVALCVHLPTPAGMLRLCAHGSQSQAAQHTCD